MDFGALPPEINSARIYFGPGSGPMLAAAAGWDGLAANLVSTATSYSSVISGLAGGPWMGPASASMAAAAAPYVAWMNTTAAQAEQAANQARAAVAAYESAFAMTVPPPVIAANRALLMSLIATNILGQNTPAIAATEAQYAEMWAQDAAAMYGYAGSSAAASILPPFTAPQPTTNPAGLAGQGAAVSQAAGISAGTNAQAVLSQVTSATPVALQQLTSPLSSTSSSSSLPPVSSALNSINPALSSTSQVAWISAALLSNASKMQDLMPAVRAATNAASVSGLTGGLGFGALGSAGLSGLGAGGTGAAVSAGLGRAASVGALSVPQTWAASTAAISPAVAALPGTGLGAVPDAVAGGPGVMLGGLPLAAGMAGRGGITGIVPDARFLERPPMLPSWPTVG
ncbi:PPE family protein [Mycobacterium intracellulare]|uniref:PPE family protein n=1 Tax=Mycobacterium intracellulare TaxID=1767 RepID=UPI00080BEF68|nr:PPE family protein [Mycobacterium intracellulare]OCB12855.1 hypothetical protein A5689_03510 [Mycobacterium intracellulare subsp. yongonense]